MNPFAWWINKFHHRHNCHECCTYGMRTRGCSARQRWPKMREHLRNEPWRAALRRKKAVGETK